MILGARSVSHATPEPFILKPGQKILVLDSLVIPSPIFPHTKLHGDFAVYSMVLALL